MSPEGLTHLDIGRGRSITDEFIPIRGLHSITVWQDEREMGRLFLIMPEERQDSVLLDVFVYWPEDRRKGYGSDMVKYVNEHYHEIITGYRNKAGLSLCLKNGYTLTRPLFKGQKAFLTFTSKKEGPHGRQ